MPNTKNKMKALEKKLPPMQQIFAKAYVFGFSLDDPDTIERLGYGGTDDDSGNWRVRMANGTKSYAYAYEKTLPKDEDTCAANAYKLLRNSQIKAYMKILVEESGFNATMMDARLREIVFKGEDKTSLQGIKHFNEMKRRVDTPGAVTINLSAKAKKLASKYTDDDDTTKTKRVAKRPATNSRKRATGLDKGNTETKEKS